MRPRRRGVHLSLSQRRDLTARMMQDHAGRAAAILLSKDKSTCQSSATGRSDGGYQCIGNTSAETAATTAGDRSAAQGRGSD
jgi:hypothetical protein